MNDTMIEPTLIFGELREPQPIPWNALGPLEMIIGRIGFRAVRYRRADLDAWAEANLVNAAGI